MIVAVRKMNLLGWALVVALAMPVPARGETEGGSQPWWKEQKIRFFWAQWHQMDEAGVPIEQTMRSLAHVGATVFADSLHMGGDRGLVWDGGVTYSVRTAKAAHEHGIRYFAGGWLHGISEFGQRVKARPSMDRQGKPYVGGGTVCPCPVDKSFYGQCFVDPVLKLVKAGLADGLHLDWERYAGSSEAGTCFCDECFKTFLISLGKVDKLPKPEERGQWLEEHNLGAAYNATHQRRRRQLFRWIEKRVHEVTPGFVFSGYYITHYDPYIAESLHTPQVPFFVVDDRHYYEPDTRPWWESLDQHFRDQGYLRIAGTYDMTFFGRR